MNLQFLTVSAFFSVFFCELMCVCVREKQRAWGRGVRVCVCAEECYASIYLLYFFLFSYMCCISCVWGVQSFKKKRVCAGGVRHLRGFKLSFSSTHLLHKRCVKESYSQRRGEEEAYYGGCNDGWRRSWITTSTRNQEVSDTLRISQIRSAAIPHCVCVWVGGILRTYTAIAKNPQYSSTLVCPSVKGMTRGEERSNRFRTISPA